MFPLHWGVWSCRVILRRQRSCGRTGAVPMSRTRTTWGGVGVGAFGEPHQGGGGRAGVPPTVGTATREPRPATWESRRVAVRSFVAFCEKRNWTTEDPVVLVRRRRVERTRPKRSRSRRWTSRGAPSRVLGYWRDHRPDRPQSGSPGNRSGGVRRFRLGDVCDCSGRVVYEVPFGQFYDRSPLSRSGVNGHDDLVLTNHPGGNY